MTISSKNLTFVDWKHHCILQEFPVNQNLLVNKLLQNAKAKFNTIFREDLAPINKHNFKKEKKSPEIVVMFLGINCMSFFLLFLSCHINRLKA